MIPHGSLLHIPGPGWLIAPAAIWARLFRDCQIITSLTTCRLKPLKKVSYREYIVSLTLSRLSTIVDSLNPKIDLDGLIPEEKVSISPCSFSDPNKYFSDPVKRQKVVYAGHLQQNKGVNILLEIVKIWPINSQYELVICGASSITQEVQNYASELSRYAAGKNITIKQSDNMAVILSDAKVFLSLQTWDNYPSQSLIEAMLSGCCIVATSSGDTNLLVKEPWGIMHDVKAPVEYYLESINKFLDLDHDEQKVIGNNAREFILYNHTVEKYIDYLHQLWQKAL
jgi:glycosyltransferase involved in cell wall biosynthesis